MSAIDALHNLIAKQDAPDMRLSDAEISAVAHLLDGSINDAISQSATLDNEVDAMAFNQRLDISKTPAAISSDLFFGTIIWRRSIGRPKTNNLWEGFRITKGNYIVFHDDNEPSKKQEIGTDFPINDCWEIDHGTEFYVVGFVDIRFKGSNTVKVSVKDEVSWTEYNELLHGRYLRTVPFATNLDGAEGGKPLRFVRVSVVRRRLPIP